MNPAPLKLTSFDFCETMKSAKQKIEKKFCSKRSGVKTLVIGLGNTITGDDGVGIYVARELKGRLNDRNISIKETHYSGLKLLDLVYDYQKVVIIDALKDGPRPFQKERDKNKRVGEVCLFEPENNNFDSTSHNLHNMNFIKNYRLLKKTHAEMPEDIKIVGISIKGVDGFKEGLSPEIKRKLPEITRRVIKFIKE